MRDLGGPARCRAARAARRRHRQARPRPGGPGVRDAGHGPYCRRVGGAIGINSQPGLFFEGLNLLKGEATALEKGMTVLVQPGVDKPAMIIVASTNVITDTGYEELTRPLPTLIQR